MRPDHIEHLFNQVARIGLSTLDFNQFMSGFFQLMKPYVPMTSLAVHFLDLGLGLVETVLMVQDDGVESMQKLTRLSPKARNLIQADLETQTGPGCLIFNRPRDHEMARDLGFDFGNEQDPSLALDLMIDRRYIGFITLCHTGGRTYTEADRELMLSLQGPLGICCANFKRYLEIQRLKDIIADNARQLQHDMLKKTGDEVVGADFGLRGVMDGVRHVAPQNSPVLLLGETGVGKEIIAGAIHRWSPRRNGPFIKVNCGSIPLSLIESEIFGHEKGAFTGAISQKRGYFERADGGTLLLDEIGELPFEAQVRLLRVLQDKEVERIGGTLPIPVDARVIAATNRDLEAMVSDGQFRRDLYYRLNVFPIWIPPLRDRQMDIPALTSHFIRAKAREMGLARHPEVRAGAVDCLLDYDWPGNVRELQNVVEREIIVKNGELLTFTDFIPAGRKALTCFDETMTPKDLQLDQVMIRHITRVLNQCGGKVEGAGGAAEVLNINPRTLQHRMRKLGIPFGRRAKGLYGPSSGEKRC